MSRPRPPFLSHEVNRHGKPVWYVRRHGKRIRLRAAYGTPEFDTEYQAALTAAPQQPSKGGPATGTLAWLIECYRQDNAWQSLSLTTRRQREHYFKQILETAGSKPIDAITTKTIKDGIKRRENISPSQARHFLDVMRGLFRWALEAEKITIDPTATITMSRRQTDGYLTWTEEHVAAYEKCWPIGTRQRVWLDVLLYTGLRRGDAVRIGRQHVAADGVATLKTEKNKVEVTLPILPVLAKTLEAGPCGALEFIVGARGKSMAKKSFSNQFEIACHAAGVPGSAHGLRKLGATRAANLGASTSQLKAIFGWTSDDMAEIYTKRADRRKLAADAMHKLGG
jgi:integrase